MWVAGPLGRLWPNGRLRRLMQLRTVRHRVSVSLVSAAAGGVNHILWDAFTHEDRWGARWLDLHHAVVGPFSTARILQYLGHTLGSAWGAWLIVRWLTDANGAGHQGGESSGGWILTLATIVGALAGFVWAAGKGFVFVPDVMRVAVGAASGLTLGCLAWPAWSRNERSRPLHTAGGD